MSALPNDELAERALLGHTLALGRIPEGVNGLAPSDFYRPVNETIWVAMRTLSDQSSPATCRPSWLISISSASLNAAKRRPFPQGNRPGAYRVATSATDRRPSSYG
jgi:DnaB-like helicase N terminal domain